MARGPDEAERRADGTRMHASHGGLDVLKGALRTVGMP